MLTFMACSAFRRVRAFSINDALSSKNCLDL
jgi:hypothetical protein